MWGAGQARPHRHSPAGEPPAPEAPSGAARGLKGRGEWGTGCTDRGVFSKWEESRGGLGQRAIGVFGDGIRAGVWVGGCGVNALGVCGHSAAQGGGLPAFLLQHQQPREISPTSSKAPPTAPHSFCFSSASTASWAAASLPPAPGGGDMGVAGDTHTCPMRSISSCSKGKAESELLCAHPHSIPAVTLQALGDVLPSRDPTSPVTLLGVPRPTDPTKCCQGCLWGAAEHSPPPCASWIPVLTWSSVPFTRCSQVATAR